MDTEIIESVLKEILEEQKAGVQVSKELDSSIKALAGKIDSFHQKLEQQKVIAPPSDTRMVQDIVASGILQIQQIVATQPKSIIRNFRLLLFPEMYAEHYYRIVFGRLLFWMMIFLFGTYLFILGKHGIESWQRIKEKETETNHYKKSWHYLYQHEKKFRSKMDSAWINS